MSMDKIYSLCQTKADLHNPFCLFPPISLLPYFMELVKAFDKYSTMWVHFNRKKKYLRKDKEKLWVK